MEVPTQLALVVALATVISPAIALACPSCFAASGARALHAYYLSTVLLTLMPFILISLFVFAGYSSYRRDSRHRKGSK